jgi:DNA-directed RNA polymerase I subunit RPA2
MIEKHEDAEEFGGYFVSNGIERLIRLLIVPRRNYPIGIIRNSFQNRGSTFSKYGVQMRCVRDDQSSMTVTIHYCTDGNIFFRFSYKKNEYMVPILLILRALVQTNDRELFDRITMCNYNNTFLTDRVEMLLRSYRGYSMYTQDQCLEYLGEKFGVVLDSPEDKTKKEVGLEFLERIVYVHLNDSRAKFDIIL